MTLRLKLFQGSLQQRNRRGEIILKEQPPTSQASRHSTVGFQGIGCRELGQLRDVLLRPARVRQRQIDWKNQAQGSAERGWMIGFFALLNGESGVVKRLVEQTSEQQTMCHPHQQKAAVM